MADAYLKPQSPILYKNDYIYPLTTYDQIILADGSRWDGTAFIPSSRTINGYTLNEDVILSASDVKALPIEGGVLTGSLRADAIAIHDRAGSNFAGISMYNQAQNAQVQWQTNFTNKSLSTYFLIYSPSGKYEKYTFPKVSTDLAANVEYQLLSSKSQVTIAQGGTGANTAEQALANLGAFSNKGGTITGDITATGTITATKVIGAVYA